MNYEQVLVATGAAVDYFCREKRVPLRKRGLLRYLMKEAAVEKFRVRGVRSDRISERQKLRLVNFLFDEVQATLRSIK